MAVYRKNDLINMVGKLQKVNSLFVAKDSVNPQADINLLINCQKIAMTVGESLEASGQDVERMVHILERYCESVYLMAEAIAAGESTIELAVALDTELKDLVAQINGEYVNRKLVVFLPYKASMWDSLESVWMKYDEDPEWDAIVVPIPYFDRNPDMSLGTMHYEGEEYPKNVPITDWESIDLKSIHPEKIYIHNPYDEYNYVTTIHPDFYCKVIKDYTDELVYIPYFVLKEIDPDDQGAIDGMNHFIQVPGVMYAHKVIVQSEAMAKIYVNEYIKFATEHGWGGKDVDREYQESRILGLGSPKMDKVLRTKKEDVDVPEEWLKKILKEDGSWKKVVFYNTTVSALINNENYLDKLEDVLRIFKENKDRVILLWRPHPLMISTLQSMQTKNFKRYADIVNNYLDEAWGIYDDTADMDRAIAMSDAYYGDGSSVVQLYEKTGKPIMIQSCEIISDTE